MIRQKTVALLRRLFRVRQPAVYPVTKPTLEHRARGTVLLSYLPECLTLSSYDKRLEAHSNLWSCRAIVDIFNRYGYNVDVIRWDDRKFKPVKDYDIILDITSNIPRLESFSTKPPVLLVLRTTADAFFNNAAEMRRVRAMEVRRGVAYTPKRLLAFPDLELKALEMAHFAALIGNEWTCSTYPPELRAKLHLLPVAGSNVTGTAKTDHRVPITRHFLFFSGAGAVHKGLDLLLEVFGRQPGHVLHIVGSFDKERDFIRAYEHELKHMSNIRYHGFLVPTDSRMKEVIDSCFCFIMPSCSEGSSSAVVTCMQLGLYPLISRESGVSLPNDGGRYLETCTIEEIEAAVLDLAGLPTDVLESEIASVQRYAAAAFSRAAFQEAMAKVVGEAIIASCCRKAAISPDGLSHTAAER